MTDTPTPSPNTEPDGPSTAVVRAPVDTPVGSSLAVAPGAWDMAKSIANTEFVPDSLRGKPHSIMACVLFAHELNVGPMEGLRVIHVIKGTPALSGELMRALVLREGHMIQPASMSSTKVTMVGRRHDQPDMPATEVTYTMDDAKRAGLDGRENWRKHPQAMLMARAS